ncbi:hypothetical protein L208DRAFT_1406945, partial [Tricholoma matsutake]
MQYMPGCPLGDCFENLTYLQKIHVRTDLALIMSSLFKIKASQCGSISCICLKKESIFPRALSHPIYAASTLSHLGSLNVPAIIHEGFSIGPVNNLIFLSYPHQIPPQLCGPFNSEHQFLVMLEVYNVIASLYQQSEVSPLFPEPFHFTHGDLSEGNILIDPGTGAITGIIDWEMASFHPAWLSAVAAGWFNNDSERFLMTDDQSAHGDYSEETPTDTLLAELDKELFCHHLQGIELRALFYACCNEYAGNTEI